MNKYYEHAGITIYHGDCREVLAPAGNRIIVDGRRLLCSPVIICDPPYGFGMYDRDADISSVFADWLRVSKVLALFGYPELLVSWCLVMNRVPGEWVTWFPTNKCAPRTNGLPRSSEHIALFGELPGADRLVRPRQSESGIAERISLSRGLDPEWARLEDVWVEPSPAMGFNSHGRLHPNQKPLSVMKNLILLCSNEADVVVDPCCGSGTTLLAAKTLNRSAIGIEIEERYCEIAAKRLSQEVFDFSEAK